MTIAFNGLTLINVNDDKSDLLSLLADRGHLNATNVRMLRIFIREWAVTPFEAVVESKIFSEGRLADLIADELNMPRMQAIDPAGIDHNVLSCVSYLEARRYTYMALNADPDDGKVVIVLADPTDALVLASIKSRFGSQVKPYICTKSDVHLTLSTAYTPEEQFGERLS